MTKKELVAVVIISLILVGIIGGYLLFKLAQPSILDVANEDISEIVIERFSVDGTKAYQMKSSKGADDLKLILKNSERILLFEKCPSSGSLRVRIKSGHEIAYSLIHGCNGSFYLRESSTRYWLVDKDKFFSLFNIIKVIE